MDTVPHRFYTVEQIAELFAVTPATVREWLKTGKLKGSKPGGSQWRISQEQFVKLANKLYGS